MKPKKHKFLIGYMQHLESKKVWHATTCAGNMQDEMSVVKRLLREGTLNPPKSAVALQQLYKHDGRGGFKVMLTGYPDRKAAHSAFIQFVEIHRGLLQTITVNPFFAEITRARKNSTTIRHIASPVSSLTLEGLKATLLQRQLDADKLMEQAEKEVRAIRQKQGKPYHQV